MIQFGEHNLNPIEDGDELWWSFDCAMIGMCRPVFDDCDSNYEVAERLKKEGVITSDMEEDSETCALCVRFDSEELARDFINNLNAYLRRWEEQSVVRLDPDQSLFLPFLPALVEIAKHAHHAYVCEGDEETWDRLSKAHTLTNDIFTDIEGRGYVLNEKGWPVARVEPNS